MKEVFSNSSIELKTLDSVDFPTRTNGSHYKEYKVWSDKAFAFAINGLRNRSQL